MFDLVNMTPLAAQFVVNCKVVEDEILRYAPGKATSGTGRRRHGKKKTERDEIFKPVHCASCGVEVGVLDQDEVYHFFNVAPSNA